MVEIINDISHIKDFDSFKHDGFETGLLNVDNTAFDDTRWPPLKKEFLKMILYSIMNYNILLI